MKPWVAGVVVGTALSFWENVRAAKIVAGCLATSVGLYAYRVIAPIVVAHYYRTHDDEPPDAGVFAKL